MKKKLLILSSVVFSAMVITINLNESTANSALPNDGNAGAPMDNAGLACTGCHGGTATQTTGVISSNIPTTGYVNGATYSFSVTMSGAAAYGFEMTPQTATSNVGLGTWIAGVGSSVSAKYIKQSAKKTGASAVWTFSWTAPATATTVTFYGGFNYANNNSASSGDIIKKSSITYSANLTGIEENIASQSLISIFPNPTTELLHITSFDRLLKGSIYSMEGKIVKTVSEQELITKTILVTDLPTGIYFIQITTSENKQVALKFSKN